MIYFVDLYKKPAPGFIDFLKGFFVSLISFNSVLILVISCLLLAFEFFFYLVPLARSILMIGCPF